MNRNYLVYSVLPNQTSIFDLKTRKYILLHLHVILYIKLWLSLIEKEEKKAQSSGRFV